MAASTQQIGDYLSDIRYGLSIMADDVNRRERLGHFRDIFKYKVRLYILTSYVEIMEDYFSQDDGAGSYATDNFFTTDDAQEIVNRINRLCDSNYTIEL